MNTGRIDFSKHTNDKLGMNQKVEVYNPTRQDEDTTDNAMLLQQCMFWWDSLRDFRERRMRNRKYYRGKQWSDTVKNDAGNYVTEEDYIKDQGKVPLKQNIIRQIVKNLIGQYRNNPTKTQIIALDRDNGSLSEMLSNALNAAKTVNQADELDARELEEFFMSGMPIQKISYQFWHERNLEDLYLENINPQRIFFNTDVADIRLHDLRLVGEILDTTLDDLIVNFARNEDDEKRIRELYSDSMSPWNIRTDGLDSDRLDYLNFYIPQDSDKCRVFEIWQQKTERRMFVHDPTVGRWEVVKYSAKQIMEENRRRLEMGLAEGIPQEKIPLVEFRQKYEKIWYVKFLTPTGHTLFEGETPYAHQSHPYSLKLYPLLDGEVWGMIEDIIDQQRYINRLIIMMDFIISASAKGVLLVPEGSIPKGMDISDFATEWSRFNGVIKYHVDPQAPNAVPQQVAANSVNIGIQEMVAMQLGFLQEVSGVQSAIQGKEAKAGTPSSLYAQQAQNASLNSLDYMEVFSSFKENRDMKALKVITQYYREKRYLAIAGNIYKEEAAIYDPSKVQDLDWQVVVSQGMDTPVYRNMIEDILMTLLENQSIDVEMFLDHTSMPFADKLLQSIRQRKEEIMQGVQGQGIPPELMQQAQGASPQAMNLINQAIGAPA